MGVAFDIAGETHYGWIDMYVSGLGPAAWIYGWAYESEPGVPIIAGNAGTIPEPSTLALLGLGFLSLCARRFHKS
jgi:hypothetical protein